MFLNSLPFISKTDAPSLIQNKWQNMLVLIPESKCVTTVLKHLAPKNYSYSKTKPVTAGYECHENQLNWIMTQRHSQASAPRTQEGSPLSSSLRVKMKMTKGLVQEQRLHYISSKEVPSSPHLLFLIHTGKTSFLGFLLAPNDDSSPTTLLQLTDSVTWKQQTG